jgi:hydroxypyruvate reductase
VIGAGKASAAMAQAFEQAWGAAVSGLVVTRYGYAVPCEQIRIVEAAHAEGHCMGVSAETQSIEVKLSLS